MTVSTDTRRVQYATNGTTGPFTVTFPFLESSHLAVTYTDSAGADTLLTLNVDYTVSGSVVTTTLAYASGGVITIDRDIPITQELDLRDGDDFPAESVEEAFDKLTMIAQQVAIDSNRVLRVPEVSANIPLLPVVADRANKVLAFDANGDPDVMVPSSGSAADVLIQLANSASAAQGPSLVAYNPALAYAGGIGQFLNYTFGHTAGEISAGVTPTNYAYAPGDVRRYGAVGDGTTNSSTAFANAIASNDFVFVPGLTFRASNLNLRSGVTIRGIGDTSRVRPVDSNDRGVITTDSGGASTYTKGVTIRDICFFSDVATTGFSEQDHLVTVNGAKDWLIDNVRFEGFRGDGLYIGSGDSGGTERHNVNIKVTNCTFDGVNNDNRQGISVIDVDGLTIENCEFLNTTRSTMPGAIDIEPDVAAYHVIKNITIRSNRFRNIGGNVGTISLLLASSTIPAPSNIVIEGNQFFNSVTSTIHAEVFLATVRTLGDSDELMSIVVRDNQGKNGSRPLDIRAVKGITIENNSFENYARGSYIGQATATDNPRNVIFARNRFSRCATSGAVAMEIFGVNYLDFAENLFDDCGNSGAGSYAIGFNIGTSSYVNLRRNVYRSPTGKTTQGIIKEAAHTFTPSTNVHDGDLFLNSLSNNFQAIDNNVKSQTFTPVVEGSTTAGTATYSLQTGVYQKRGSMIWFEIRLTWTGHTGTGNMLVTLPANIGGASFVPVTIISETIAYTASRFPAAGISSANQRVNIYQFQSGGANAAIAMAAAGTLYLSGSYPTA